MALVVRAASSAGTLDESRSGARRDRPAGRRRRPGRGLAQRSANRRLAVRALRRRAACDPACRSALTFGPGRPFGPCPGRCGSCAPSSAGRGVRVDGLQGGQGPDRRRRRSCEPVAGEAALVEVVEEALPLGGAFGARQPKVDDLLLPVGPEAQSHQRRDDFEGLRRIGAPDVLDSRGEKPSGLFFGAQGSSPGAAVSIRCGRFCFRCSAPAFAGWMILSKSGCGANCVSTF